AVAGLWSAWLVAGRSRTMMAAIFPCFIALLVAAPFVLGEAPVWTSHGMVYNRYGYALLAIILLECFQPPARPTIGIQRWVFGPLFSGCAAAILLFLKVTYFIIALPLFGISLALWGRRKQRSLAYTLGFAATALLFLAYLRFDVPAMVSDLLAAGA